MARFTDKEGNSIIEGSLIKRYGITYTVKEAEGKLGYFIGDVHYGWVNIGSNEDFEEVSINYQYPKITGQTVVEHYMSVRTDFGKAINPLNDNGEIYDIWNELYSNNIHGNRFRYTDKEGELVDKMVNGTEVFDHMTGEVWTVKSDWTRATKEEIDSLK